MEHMFRRRSHLRHTRWWVDILITKDGLWTLMDVIIVDLTHTKYGATNINDDNTCNNDGCLGEDMIICWASIKWWFHSPCYWDIWVSSFSFWFIFDHLCIDHYCMSSIVFFNPFDACFLLLIVHVHNPTMCIMSCPYARPHAWWPVTGMPVISFRVTVWL
jgi:hypothetical protein